MKSYPTISAHSKKLVAFKTLDQDEVEPMIRLVSAVAFKFGCNLFLFCALGIACTSAFALSGKYGEEQDAGVCEVILSNIINPVTATAIRVKNGPLGNEAKQIEGPKVSHLSYEDGLLRFISPADVGIDYSLVFELGDQKNPVYRINYESRAPAPIIMAGDEGDVDAPPSSPISADLTLSVEGMINNLVLPENFDRLSFSLYDKKGAAEFDEDVLFLNLHTMQGYIPILEFFDVRSNNITLKKANESEFRGLLDSGMLTINLDGADTVGRYFGYEITFFHGVNSLCGAFLNKIDNKAGDLYKRSRLAVHGMNSGIALSAAIKRNGSFELDYLPTDDYSINLVDPRHEYSATLWLKLPSTRGCVKLPLYGPKLIQNKQL